MNAFISFSNSVGEEVENRRHKGPVVLKDASMPGIRIARQLGLRQTASHVARMAAVAPPATAAIANATVLGYMNKMLLDEVVPILPLDQEDCKKFAAAVQDRFNNPFVNHELMSISLNSTSKWRARNMPSFLEYIEKNGKLPTCLTMSFAAYIAFYSNNIQELNDKGLVCKRAKGNEYTISDDRYVLEFYNAHKDDDIPTLVHAVMTNEQMWGQDLTKVAGFEEATVKNLTLIREQGAMAAYKSCL